VGDEVHAVRLLFMFSFVAPLIETKSTLPLVGSVMFCERSL
jgi:hypothetical protein